MECGAPSPTPMHDTAERTNGVRSVDGSMCVTSRSTHLVLTRHTVRGCEVCEHGLNARAPGTAHKQKPKQAKRKH